jgi:anti-sigma factor RsiW
MGPEQEKSECIPSDKLADFCGPNTSLTDEERARIEEHLHACPECEQQTVAEAVARFDAVEGLAKLRARLEGDKAGSHQIPPEASTNP